MPKVNYPFGPSDVIDGANVATNTITIENEGLSLVRIPVLAQNTTLNINLGAPMRVGTTIWVQWSSDATGRTLIPGNNMRQTNSITGVASKTKTALFMWDGVAFAHVSSGLDY